MNARNVLYRKVAYLVGIVLLLFPLFWLGRPEVRDESGRLQSGGTLAQMRHEMGLSPAELGEIDPASQTMKLATLGLRGIASLILWQQADEYHEKENWDKLAATLNTLRRLQPHYISVWDFQAWNLSYNVAKEFDHYEHRYLWVKRGIEFLMTGTRYNRHNPRLLWSLGWFTGYKIGTADEKKEYRELFRDDVDFHVQLNEYINVDEARGVGGKPDNWLMGRLWYLRAIDVDVAGIPVQWMRQSEESETITKRKRSAVLFYHDPPKQILNYAQAITEELLPGDTSREAWGWGHREFSEFGNREIALYDGRIIRLNDLERLVDEINELVRQLDELAPGLREKIREEKRAKLTSEEREALATPPRQRTAEQHEIVMSMRDKLLGDEIFVGDAEVVERLPEEKKVRGRELMRRIEDKRKLARSIDNQRATINYEYWLKRSDIEQQKNTAEARRLVRKADEAKANGNPEEAKKLYEEAWDRWAVIFDAHPELITDVMAEDLKPSLDNYEVVLRQLDLPFPEDFKLKRLREYYREREEWEYLQSQLPPSQ